MFNMGFSEMLIVGAIALIFIGPKQLPSLAKALGRTISELKKAMNDVTESVHVNLRDEETIFPDQLPPAHVEKTAEHHEEEDITQPLIKKDDT